MDFLKDEGGQINSNKISTLIFLLSIPISLQAAIMGYIPAEYTPLVISLFGVLSEVINYLKGGLTQPDNTSDEDVA